MWKGCCFNSFKYENESLNNLYSEYLNTSRVNSSLLKKIIYKLKTKYIPLYLSGLTYNMCRVQCCCSYWHNYSKHGNKPLI